MIIPNLNVNDNASSAWGNSIVDSLNDAPWAFGNVCGWKPIATTAAFRTVGGGGAQVDTGTLTAATPATTNQHTAAHRVEYLQTVAGTTNAAGGLFHPAAAWCRGNAANIGGFRLVMRWAPATGVSNTSARSFVGMSAQTTVTDVQPSSLVNIVGVGYDAADTDMQFMWNDASGTATKSVVKYFSGINAAIPLVDRTSYFQLEIIAAANGAVIDMRFTDLVSGLVASKQAASDMPVNTTMLRPAAWVSVGGVSAVCGISIFSTMIGSEA